MARAKEFNPEKAVAKALQIFWQYGYEATSMQMLVKATGLSRSSLYDTFGDKRQLYTTALAQYQAQTESEFAAERPLSPLTLIRQRFQSIVNTVSPDNESKGCFIVNTAVELCQHDNDLCQTVQDAFLASENWFFDMLEMAKEAKELPSDFDSRAAARFLLNASCGMQVLVKAKKDPRVLQDAIDTTLSILN